MLGRLQPCDDSWFRHPILLEQRDNTPGQSVQYRSPYVAQYTKLKIRDAEFSGKGLIAEQYSAN